MTDGEYRDQAQIFLKTEVFDYIQDKRFWIIKFTLFIGDIDNHNCKHAQLNDKITNREHLRKE